MGVQTLQFSVISKRNIETIFIFLILSYFFFPCLCIILWAKNWSCQETQLLYSVSDPGHHVKKNENGLSSPSSCPVKKLFNYLEEKGISPEQASYVYVSHCQMKLLYHLFFFLMAANLFKTLPQDDTGNEDTYKCTNYCIAYWAWIW